jgi:hypothetical protein
MRAKYLTRICLIVILPFLMSFSCDPLSGIEQEIQNAIDALESQSSEWQSTLKDLEATLKRDAQDTIANEVTQIAERGIATGGTEIRCSADFIGVRMKEDLSALLQRLKREKNIPPRKQYFCDVAPTQINLALVAQDRETELDFYGYNLDSGHAAISVTDTEGHTREIPSNVVATPTHYLMTINLGRRNGVQFTQADQQMVIVLNPDLRSTDRHSVNIVAAPPPPQFSISNAGDDLHDGGGGFGTPTNSDCPAGSVASGLQGRTGDFVDQLQLLCSHLNEDGTLGNASSLTAIGGPGGSPFPSLSCTHGEVIVGFSGGASGNLERIGVWCDSVQSVAAQIGNAHEIGETHSGPGGTPFQNTCKAGSAVTGLRLHKGNDPDTIKHFAYACSKITTTAQ